jgi:glycosyltransferase involved in cell wall biosynthesis
MDITSSNRKKAVIIGGEGTLWPGLNADWVSRAGFDTTVLFFSKPDPENIPVGVHFATEEIHYSIIDRMLWLGWSAIVVIATLISWLHFRKINRRSPARYDLPLTDNPITAGKKAYIIDQLKPDLLIGHNMSLCGQVLSKASAEKKVMIGWGSDFTESYHSSVLHRRLTASICESVDLFVSGCQTALESLQQSFPIEDRRVFRNTYLDKHTIDLITNPVKKSTIRTEFKIPDNAKIVFNSRRFKPVFGGPQGFSACIEVAKERADVWFIFIEGRNNSKWMKKSRTQLHLVPTEISRRFIIFEGELPYQKVIDIFAASDVFLSLRKQGDMRSATVTQGASMGLVPVLSTYNEWQVMKDKGFEALLVDPDQPKELVKIILQALDTLKTEVAQKNRVYLEKYENDEIYFERFKVRLNKLVED